MTICSVIWDIKYENGKMTSPLRFKVIHLAQGTHKNEMGENEEELQAAYNLGGIRKEN
jgi:hypothetical protein